MPHRLPPFYARLRFATAAISTWLMNLNMFGFSLKRICAPGFNCHGCPWATFACPVGVMAYGSAIHTIPVLAIGSVLAVGAVAGRIICSFACPVGLFQDLMHKIPGPKLKMPKIGRYGKYLALVLLVMLLPWFFGFEYSGFLAIDKPEINKGTGNTIDVKVVVTNAGTEPVERPELIVTYRNKDSGQEIFREKKTFPDVTLAPGDIMALPAFAVENHLDQGDLVLDSPQSVAEPNPRYQLYYCALCPAGTLTSNIPRAIGMSGSWGELWERLSKYWLRIAILLLFLLLVILFSRPFCHTFCPLGAVYALTAPVALSRMKLDPDACTECGACEKVCPMDLKVSREVGGRDCIACGDCMKVCPRGGIRRAFGL